MAPIVVAELAPAGRDVDYGPAFISDLKAELKSERWHETFECVHASLFELLFSDRDGGAHAVDVVDMRAEADAVARSERAKFVLPTAAEVRRLQWLQRVSDEDPSFAQA